LCATFDKEKTEIEKQFHARFADSYKLREQIISGQIEPTEEIIKAYEEKKTKEAEEKKEETKKVEEVKKGDEEQKGIPDFWYHALCNCEHLESLLEINANDVPILSYIENVSLEYLPEGELEVPTGEKGEKGKEIMQKFLTEGFKIIFTFGDNKYFKVKELTKSFILTREEHELVLVKVIGTKIDWNEKCDPTKTLVKKAVKPAGRGRKRGGNRAAAQKSIFVEEEVPSFFSFFAESDPEEDEEDENNLCERDFAVASIIKESLIPRAVDYYMGKIKPDEMIFDEDEDEDEDEDDDECDSCDELDAHKGADPTPVVENPECKQQ
jgi:nucleosome assembly protein 1-like 1